MGGEQIPTKHALFELAAYTGAVVSDLFGEDRYFADPEAFWTLQSDAMAKLKASLEALGWSRVEVLERGQRFHSWEYESATKEKGGAVFITVSNWGEVEVHKGFTLIGRNMQRQRHQEFIHFLNAVETEVPKAKAGHVILDN